MKCQLREVNRSGVIYLQLAFICPGCASFGGSGLHMLPVNSFAIPSWMFNGDLEKPTLTPSIFSNSGPDGHHVCHSFLTDGVFNFLSDSTHIYSGKQIPIPDLPDWFNKGEN